jgi:hypothetical protein
VTKQYHHTIRNLSNRVRAFRVEPWALVILLLLAFGLLERLLPFALGRSSIFQHWPTEDGYLNLTVARNFALGYGLSVADGTVPTNGIQPLVTFLFSPGFLLSSGDKLVGVVFCLLLQTGLSVLSAWLMYRLARRFLPDTAQNRFAAALGAGLWFVGPITLPHSMNCLESALYISCILTTITYWYAWVASPSPCVERGRALRLGLLLGLTAWARIDAVFVVASLCCAHLLPGLIPASRRCLPKLLIEASIASFVCVAIISPWLLYAKTNFGSWMPVSGIAESHGAVLGGNLSLVPAHIFEYVTAVVSVPSVIKNSTWGQLACGAGVAVWIVIVVSRYRGATMRQLQLLVLLAALGSSLIVYYGAFFGAEHFLSRYFFPVSVVVSPLTACIVVSFTCKKVPRPLWIPVVVIGLAAVLAQQAVIFVRESRHPYSSWPAVAWVERNVPDEVWVGAAQSGTLGFFHDRTLNFDGKVDPYSLRARLENRLFDYIEKSSAQALVDWNCFKKWNEMPAIRRSFDLVVDSPETNLAVFLRRQGPLCRQQPH